MLHFDRDTEVWTTLPKVAALQCPPGSRTGYLSISTAIRRAVACHTTPAYNVRRLVRSAQKLVRKTSHVCRSRIFFRPNSIVNTHLFARQQPLSAHVPSGGWKLLFGEQWTQSGDLWCFCDSSTLYTVIRTYFVTEVFNKDVNKIAFY